MHPLLNLPTQGSIIWPCYLLADVLPSQSEVKCLAPFSPTTYSALQYAPPLASYSPPPTDHGFDHNSSPATITQPQKPLIHAECTAPLQGVPFIEEISSHTCDHRGATLSIHDITVTIPPGAIPDEVTAHIEMGVTLYGPFKFPDNHQQVSPILWFCVQKDVKFLLPLTFRLPHVLADTSQANITFAKAGHLTYQDTMKRNMFTFEPVHNRESDFTKESGYGYLSSKHCCFLCLSAENNITKDLALQKGYCLHILIEKRSPAYYRILLVFTYFLSTCFEVYAFIIHTSFACIWWVF